MDEPHVGQERTGSREAVKASVLGRRVPIRWGVFLVRNTPFAFSEPIPPFFPYPPWKRLTP